MSVALFGPIVEKGHVESAVLALLERWIDTYLRELEERHGWEEGHIERPRSWITVREFEGWPEDQIPCVMVRSPGLHDQPEKDGDGAYRARWSFGVAVVVSADTQANTETLAGIFGAAVRAILLQKPGFAQTDLEDLSRGVTWLDEDYDDIDREKRRTIGAVTEIFFVEVDQVVSDSHGPREPAPPIDENWPHEATDVAAAVQPLEGS